MTLQSLLVVLAFLAACCGVFGVNLGKRSDGTPRRNPNWVALCLAFFLFSILIVSLR